MKAVLTWEQALTILKALMFNLGQSPNTIKAMFDDGYHLEYCPVNNYYYWVN